LVATVTVPIAVLNTNRPPVVTPLADQVVDRGATLDIPVQAADPDGDPMVLTVAGLPRFATFTDHGDGTGVIHVAPGAGARGDYALVVTATDDGDGGGPGEVLSNSQSFVLTVNAPNDPPRLDPIGDAVAVIGQPLNLAITAHDLDQDTLTFTAD